MNTPQTVKTIQLLVNGARVEREVEVRTLLSTFLRDDLGLTGTHVACEHGVCGSCTILVDGRAVRSCLLLAVQTDGTSVETVEGLGSLGDLSPLQEAMWREHGLQCGFCTPGILMSIEGEARSGSSAEDICDEVLSGHVCRCTGYQNIRTAIHAYFAARDGS
jgi:aerobic-type carbon monoxide dehydrogenase small subunit (CoxS/CutS family)